MPDTWTLDSLWLHFTTLLKDKESKDVERFATNEKKVESALNALNKRFEGINELRGAMQDQQRSFMPRQEAEIQINALKEEIRQLKESNLKSASKGEGSHTTWILIVGIVSFVSLILGIIARFQ